MPISAPVHRPTGYQSRTEQRAAYAAARSGPGNPYKLQRWLKIRAAYLATHPLCECGCNRIATVVDHKQPHRGDMELMFSWDNLQAMTKACHDRKTALQDGGFGNPVG